MKTIIKWTLRQRRWSIFWWCIGVLTFIALELSVYPSVKDQAAQLNQALANMPSAVKSLFGTSDLFSPVGYLNSRIFYLMLPLLLSILAIGLGSSLIAREESDGTLELLLARPISRGRLLISKLASGLIIVTTVWAVATASILVFTKIVGLPMASSKIIFAAVMSYLVALIFGTFAFMIASLGRLGRGASIGLASMIGLGSYIIASLEANVHWLDWPAKVLPYHYYNPAQILNGSQPWLVAFFYTLIIAGLVFLGWLAFRRRDIG